MVDRAADSKPKASHSIPRFSYKGQLPHIPTKPLKNDQIDMVF